jgi:DNA-binding response OmpR family regulator
MEDFKIMLVEDEERIRDLEAEALRRWGYRVVTPDPLLDLLAVFAREEPSLVVLDVGLPRLDGYEWCARIRESSKAPILFLTARSSPSDQVRALATGADDWLAKPFDSEVFVAKVRALLRRSYSWAPDSPPLLQRGDLVFDRGRHSACKDGRRAELTRNEAILLGRLMEKDGRIATRDELMEALWSAETFADDNSLTVNMTRLKRALEGIGAGGLILTERGAGYRLA